MSDMHSGATAMTKKEHDELVAIKGRPLTLTEPIHRKTVDDKPAPDISDPDWFGVLPSKVVPPGIGDVA